MSSREEVSPGNISKKKVKVKEKKTGFFLFVMMQSERYAISAVMRSGGDRADRADETRTKCGRESMEENIQNVVHVAIFHCPLS